MSRFALLAAVLTFSGLASCAPGAALDDPVSPRAAARFEAEMAGRVAGRPQSCLSNLRSANVVAARNGTLLFRDGGTVFANRTSGGCDALADNMYTLVTENFGGSLCSGTIARVVDLTANGILRGSCALGDFTPYRRPGR